ncbi:MAG: hypothetical protein AABX70_04050 [Nanoarchaeota archaeon]
MEKNIGKNIVGQEAVESAGKQLPEKKIRIGAITATIWKNESKSKEGENYIYRTVSFGRSYKDKSGVWQSTNSLRANDLPKASLVLSKAYEFLSFEVAQDEEA